MEGKASFILYTDYWDHLELLNVEERGELITAIFAYVRHGALPEFSGGLKMAFSFIRTQLDRDKTKWETTKLVRSKAGKKGADSRWGSKGHEE